MCMRKNHLSGSAVTKKISISVFICLLTSLLLCSSFAFVFASDGSDIMFQSFGWDSKNDGQQGKWYDLVADRAKELGDAGFTLIWLPPAARSVSQQGYMPVDYYDLGNPSSPTFYGTQDQLVNCINKLHDNNISVLADIVVNHRCASKQDETGLWNNFDSPSGLAKWNKNMICGDDKHFDGRGNNDTGDQYGVAPDIDHKNLTVQKDITAWMNWLKKVGFDGWRYDYVKGYAPKFVALYDSETAPKFSVGELWTSMNYGKSMMTRDDPPAPNQDAHRQQLCNWLDNAGKTAATFDFTTKGILQYAVRGEYGRLRDKDGKASGLIGWWPARSVTFVDNHDTGSAQSHWPFPNDKVMQGYAYILTHPGTPCVFTEHFYEWKLKDAITKLMQIRKKYKIKADSKLTIMTAENGLYAASIDDKIITKLGPRDFQPPAGYKLLTSGSDFAVFGK